jgi:hypothetical protein
MLRNLIYLLKIKFKGFQKSSGFMDVDVNVNFFYVHRKPSLSDNKNLISLKLKGTIGGCDFYTHNFSTH